MMEGIAKLPVLQGLRCFYVGPSSVGVAGAMIKAGMWKNLVIEDVAVLVVSTTIGRRPVSFGVIPRPVQKPIKTNTSGP
jgi:hypothetical protein